MVWVLFCKPATLLHPLPPPKKKTESKKASFENPLPKVVEVKAEGVIKEEILLLGFFGTLSLSFSQTKKWPKIARATFKIPLFSRWEQKTFLVISLFDLFWENGISRRRIVCLLPVFLRTICDSSHVRAESPREHLDERGENAHCECYGILDFFSFTLIRAPKKVYRQTCTCLVAVYGIISIFGFLSQGNNVKSRTS